MNIRTIFIDTILKFEIMSKNIILASSALLIAGIFFVLNDAIINYLSSINIQFYHFIFYGSPAYLAVPIYLFF